jgi:hypothetical protein
MFTSEYLFGVHRNHLVRRSKEQDVIVSVRMPVSLVISGQTLQPVFEGQCPDRTGVDAGPAGRTIMPG